MSGPGELLPLKVADDQFLDASVGGFYGMTKLLQPLTEKNNTASSNLHPDNSNLLNHHNILQNNTIKYKHIK